MLYYGCKGGFYDSIRLTVFALCLLLIGAGAVPVPVNYAAGQDPLFSSSLSVGNYEAGAALTEMYLSTEHLDRQTEVVSYGREDGSGALEASMNSNFIGSAHLAWESADLGNGRRPMTVGRSVEDLTGVFSIQKFVQLWSNSTPGQVGIEWLPCV